MRNMKESISHTSKHYFENGYHCAEAIVAAVLEGMGFDASEAIAHATPFGGGRHQGRIDKIAEIEQAYSTWNAQNSKA